MHNSNTEYHDRIVNLVNSNVNLIRQRISGIVSTYNTTQ